MRIITVANQKGGVGKTTLSAHLVYHAQEHGRRVLVIDLDAQANLSHTFARAKTGGGKPLAASALFREDKPGAQPAEVSPGIFLVEADAALVDVDGQAALALVAGRAIRALAQGYDLCIIDTPPSFGVRQMAGLVAADAVITPIGIGLYELDGVAALLETIRAVRTKGYNPRLQHLGLLPIKINERSKLESETLAGLRKAYGKHVTPYSLPERTAVKTATARGRPVWLGTKGESHLKAAREWRTACSNILSI